MKKEQKEKMRFKKDMLLIATMSNKKLLRSAIGYIAMLQNKNISKVVEMDSVSQIEIHVPGFKNKYLSL